MEDKHQSRQVPVSPPSQWALSAADVSVASGLSVQTVRRLIRAGQLPSVRIGGQYRVPVAAIDALLRSVADADLPPAA